MKKGTKIGVGVAGAAMLACAGLAPFAYAQSQELQEDFNDFRESVREAVDAGDYNSWSTLMADHANERCEIALENITPETFDGIQRVHERKEAGDHEGARELAKELDLPMFGKGGKGMRGGGMGMKGNGEMKEILDAGDYDAWATFMEEHEGKGPMHGQVEVNEETFNHMLEVHDLMEAGDKEGVKELREQFRQQNQE